MTEILLSATEVTHTEERLDPAYVRAFLGDDETPCPEGTFDWMLPQRGFKGVSATVEVRDRDVLVTVTDKQLHACVTTEVRFADFENLYDTADVAGRWFAASDLSDAVESTVMTLARMVVDGGYPLRYRSMTA
ncbi:MULTISPECIES: hypothetical protein [Mycolicibacterium]|uniref:hypothetical protein n=1 Tax=Mycolicibacterium TaxID=1866885 RepID=UPI000AD1CCEA|nr:hypothetical protein [Mycolicibacterium fortuitum]